MQNIENAAKWGKAKQIVIRQNKKIVGAQN